MLKSPPAQRVQALLQNDPQMFWRALHFYLRFAEVTALAAGLRASLVSLDAENRSQLALFAAGAESAPHQLQSSPRALESQIERFSKEPRFKTSIADFFRANPRSIAQLSAPLLQDILEVAENPRVVHALHKPSDERSQFLFSEGGVPPRSRFHLTIPSWLLPLGTFFFGSIITAFIISALLARSHVGTQTVLEPMYITPPKVPASPALRPPPKNLIAPPQLGTRQFGPFTEPPGATLASPRRAISQRDPALSPNLKVPPSSVSAPRRPRIAGPQPRAGATDQGGHISGAAADAPTPAASESPLNVEPENQNFVAVPYPSPGAGASISPSAVMLAVPTPLVERSPAAASKTAPPTASPTPKGARRRIRFGYHCAKCPK